MEYLGDKLSVAHSQVSAWAGSVRRSLQEALGLLAGGAEQPEGQASPAETEDGAGGGGGFRRATSLRGLALRSRESIRSFTARSQRHLSLRSARRRLPGGVTEPQHADSQRVVGGVSGDEGLRDTDRLIASTDDGYGALDTTARRADGSPEDDPSTLAEKSTDRPEKREVPSEPNTPSTFSPVDDEETEPLPFPETPTSLLDSSALRSRVQLRKRRSQRAPPSKAARHRALSVQEDNVDGDWRFRDSTEKSEQAAEDDSDTEEEPKGRECRPPAAQPQRVPLFLGIDPSVLKAQLKKRGDVEDEPEPPAPSRTSVSPSVPQAVRVLPPVADKNSREPSPQWLQELKSKKRLSQYESDI